MAGVATINLSLSVSGLGGATYTLPVSFTGTTPTAVTQGYRSLAKATSEALPLGDVTTVEGVLIHCITATTALQIDPVYASISNELTLGEGESCYFKPSGTIHINNTDADDAAVYEYLVFGTL